MNASPESQKNLIMGIIKHYDFPKIKPFLLSLKNSGYQGDICLFYSQLSSETLRYLEKFSEEYPALKLILFSESPYLSIPYKIENKRLVFKKIYPYLLLDNYLLNRVHLFAVNTITKVLHSLTQQKELVLKARLTKSYLHLGNHRYLLYYLYLLEHGKNYSKIFLTDVRDVLFQNDPFSFDFPTGLCCFYEKDNFKIKDCRYTSQWTAKSFDKQVLNEIEDQQVTCAGTTMGTKEAIFLYLEYMIHYIVQAKYQGFGADQAVHNYLLYKGLLNNVTFYGNHQGPVLTMDYMKESELAFDEQGFLVNHDGSIINVLHQYDRQQPEIKEKMTVYKTSECTS